MRAELEVSASNDELSGMTARLAPPTVFQQAGIDYASALLDLRFAIEKRPGGRSVVKVSSVKPINEPFLDFLVELNWPAGRLVREYTFLLDPPEMAVKQAPQAAVDARVVEVARDDDRQGATIVPRRPAPASVKEPQAGQTRVVKRGDTLRKIADENHYEGVSLEQMLVGIFRNNPDAFSGANMNRLKAGAILDMPEKSAVAAIPEAEAKREFKTQAANWNAYRQKLAATTAAAPTPDTTGGQSSSGQITARVQEKATAAEQPKDQVKVARTEVGAPGAPAANAAAAEADRIAREKAMKEAQERVALLEKNVGELQKLVELKNQQLAELQQQAARKDAAKAPEAPPKPAEAPKPAEPPKVAEAPKPAEPPKAAEAPKAVEPPPPAPAPVVAPPKAEEPPAAKPVEPPPVEEAAKAPEAAPPPAPVEPPKPPEAAKPAEKPKAPPPPEPEAEEPGILDGLLEDPLPLVGGAGALALVAGGYLLYRRRRIAASETTTPIAQSILGPNSVFRMSGGQSVDTGNTPPQSSDFSQTGPGTIDTDEVDPVAEADVYMAYGRDTQAEEILLEAMQKDPHRLAIHAKLLEIYANRRSLKQFETLASELYAQTGGHGPEWEKVAALGIGLDPQNPLYSGGKAVAKEPPFNADSTVLISAADINRSAMATATNMPAAQVAALEAKAEEDLRDTLVLGDITLPEEAPPAPAEAPVELSSLDFDLGFSGGGAQEAKPAAAKAPAPAPAAAPARPMPDFSLAAEPDAPDNDTALDFDVSGDVPLEATATVVGELRMPEDFAASPDSGVDTWTRTPKAVKSDGAGHSFSPDGTLVIPSPADKAANPRLAAAASTFVGTGEQLKKAGEPAATPPQAAPEAVPEISFDAAPENFGEATQIHAPQNKLDEAPIIAPLAFDSGSARGEPKASPARPAPITADADGVEFDVSLTDSVFLGEPMAPPEFDIGAINLDLSAAPAPAPKPAAAPPAEEAPVGTTTALRQWEEVNTKLDLAKAYEEMGDLEGARELLQEVMGEGSPDLVEQAQAILARIGG